MSKQIPKLWGVVNDLLRFSTMHKHCRNCGCPISPKSEIAFIMGICDTCRMAMQDYKAGKTEALEE